MSKVCSACGIDKPFSEYTKRYDRPVGVRPRCKECQRKVDANIRLTDAGKKKYRKQLWRKSGIEITYEEYKERYEAIEGKCEICDEQFPSLCVDHNHETGEVRGLLCTPCNLAIEHLKESSNIMKKAIEYIENYGGRNV